MSNSCNPTDYSTPGSSVHHQLSELAQTQVHHIGDAIHHLILCLPLYILPSIFPSIRVFSDESVLQIRWPKYWNFSISPASEYSGLISFKIDWFDLVVQGTLQESSSSPQFEIISSSALSLLYGSEYHPFPRFSLP